MVAQVDESAAPGMPASRLGAFQGGQDAGLSQDSARYNSMVPKTSVQTSVLQPNRPSMNGMASSDYERVLPGVPGILPSANGSSSDSWQKSIFMRLQGRAAD